MVKLFFLSGKKKNQGPVVCKPINANPRLQVNPGPGSSKDDYANPGLARILISVLQLFSEVSCLSFLSFCFDFD